VRVTPLTGEAENTELFVWADLEVVHPKKENPGARRKTEFHINEDSSNGLTEKDFAKLKDLIAAKLEEL